jgi:hypothetical protein
MLRNLYITQGIDPGAMVEYGKRRIKAGEQVIIHWHAVGQKCNDICVELDSEPKTG